MADPLIFLANLDDVRYAALTDPLHCPLINVGSGEDLSIRALAETVAEVVGYTGRFVQDTSKPDGTMRKIMDVSKVRSFGWAPTIDLRTGIQKAYESYLCDRA